MYIIIVSIECLLKCQNLTELSIKMKQIQTLDSLQHLRLCYQDQNNCTIKLLYESIFSQYQQLQTITIKRQQLYGINEIWENKTDQPIKNLSYFIYKLIMKFKKQINLQEQYNQYITNYSSCNSLLQCSKFGDLEPQISPDILLQQCTSYKKLISLGNRHNFRTIMIEGALKCSELKLKNQPFSKILNQIKQFVNQFCKSRVVKQFNQILKQFEKQLSALSQIKCEQTQAKHNSEQLIRLKIDLEIINAEIIDDFQALLEFDVNGQHSTQLCNALTNFLNSIQKADYRQFVVDMIKQLDYIFAESSSSLIQSSELFCYINNQSKNLINNGQIVEQLPQYTTTKHKNKQIMAQYRDYCENLYEKYVYGFQLTDNQPLLDQNQFYIYQQAPSQKISNTQQKLQFMERLKSDIINIICQYINTEHNKQKAQSRIRQIQNKIISLQIQISHQKNSECDKYNLPLQRNDNYDQNTKKRSKNVKQIDNVQKNNQACQNDNVEYWVYRQIYVSMKPKKSSKGSKNNNEISNCFKKQKKIEFNKKSFILKDSLSNNNQEIFIKKINKIIKINVNQLIFQFTKGYLHLQFINNQNYSGDLYLKHFLTTFVQNYGQQYHSIVFQNQFKINSHKSHSTLNSDYSYQ